MISIYLLINILIIIVPLLLTFERNINYYKKLPVLFTSILIVGGAYIIWDIIATFRGDWGFNPEYISGLKIINLPIEEILFFVTVPYSGIFLYETGKFYLGDKSIQINKPFFYFLAALLIILSIIFIDQYYTFTVMLFSAFFIIFALLLHSRIPILNSSLYWKWILFMYIPFFLVNYFLTSLPVVTYSPNAIWGIRITTIPFEDFFYSFSMLSFYLYIYLIIRKKWSKEKE
ncbi:MAG: lycopene cyclase domain-containing protein [Ignavibacteria bacterium]|nr:lycopene cyclase domain-containing protein [Ignavibacteria bacterium]